MSEDTDPVGNSQGAEGEGQSSSTGNQQSPDLTALNQRLDRIEKMFTGIQKGNDKVNARVEQKVSETLSNLQIGRIAELAKAGKSSEEIENQLLLEDLLAERKGGKSSGAPEGKQSAGVNEVSNILKGLVSEFGLDANDAAVADALAKNDVAALARVAKSRITVPDPDASTEPPISGKQKQDDSTNERALQSSYDKELADLQKLTPGRRVNPAALANLKAKYRRKGLNLH